jgi:hypothetical protein
MYKYVYINSASRESTRAFQQAAMFIIFSPVCGQLVSRFLFQPLKALLELVCRHSRVMINECNTPTTKVSQKTPREFRIIQKIGPLALCPGYLSCTCASRPLRVW